MITANSRTSTAVETLKADPGTGKVEVQFKNGGTHSYENVDRNAISEMLSNDLISLGFWTNRYCLQSTVAA